jgi:hypothetical protein
MLFCSCHAHEDEGMAPEWGGWRGGEKNFWQKMKFGVRARGVCVNR